MKVEGSITYWSFTPTPSELLPQHKRRGWEEAQKQKGTDGELCVGDQSLYFHEWFLLQKKPRFLNKLTPLPTNPQAKELKGFSFEVLSAYLESIYTESLPQNLSGKVLYHLYRLGLQCDDPTLLEEIEKRLFVGMKPEALSELIGEWKGEAQLRNLMVRCLALGMIDEAYYDCLLSVLPYEQHKAWKGLRDSFISDSNLRSQELIPMVRKIFPGIHISAEEPFVDKLRGMKAKIRANYWKDFKEQAPSTDYALTFCPRNENNKSFTTHIHKVIFQEEVDQDNLPEKSASLNAKMEHPTLIGSRILEILYTGKFDKKGLSLWDSEGLFVFASQASHQEVKKYSNTLISRRIRTSDLKAFLSEHSSWKDRSADWVKTVLNTINRSPRGQKRFQTYLTRDSMKSIQGQVKEHANLKKILDTMEAEEAKLLTKYPNLNK